MHPIHHKERRNARAQALEKLFKHCEEVVYVDAAEYKVQDAFAVAAVDNKLKHITAATVYVRRPEEAEDAAISVAIISTKAKFIFNDYKTAVRNFAKNNIHEAASQIVLTNQFEPRQVQIIWIPAHSFHPGNEVLPENSSTGRWTNHACEGLRSVWLLFKRLHLTKEMKD
ncbi:hypothetical protein HPB48_009910 [Haemaphysalis longicornis]|uniref:Uncharacterized protein n=1 Tax=Haemaphysalis longicornis TaxID=44386 RepID=A0A9J6GX85_HAELO|nr:hypothetical protein HPB48_009910 [Haemaphysalis longicornis]